MNCVRAFGYIKYFQKLKSLLLLLTEEEKKYLGMVIFKMFSYFLTKMSINLVLLIL